MQTKVKLEIPKLALGTYHQQLREASVDDGRVHQKNEDHVVANGDDNSKLEKMSTEGAARHSQCKGRLNQTFAYSTNKVMPLPATQM